MATSMPCKDCATGSLHRGTPTGRVSTVHGLPTYIAEPPSGEPKGLIVYIHDAFGWELPNSRLLADTYAKRTNCRVYLPDFLNGHWLSHSLLTDLDTVMQKPPASAWDYLYKVFPFLRSAAGFAPYLFFNRLSVTQPRVFSFFHSLRAHEGSTLPVGTAGFCWGGKLVTLLCQDSEKASSNGKPLVDAGFTAHPSMLVVPADVEPVKLPLSICIGDVDFALPVDGVKVIQQVFEKKAERESGRYELVVIPGAKHGFAVRGDEVDKTQLEQAQRAEDQAVEWFRKWMGLGDEER